MKHRDEWDWHEPPPTENLPDRLAWYLRHGEKLLAVKEYRKETGRSLQECLDFVNSILDGLKLMNDDGGPVVDQAVEIVLPSFVRSVQDIVVETIPKPSGANPNKTSVMEVLSEHSLDTVVNALGDFGRCILAFSALVHKGHPSLVDVNNGTLLEGGKVYQRVWEQMKIASLAQEQSFKEIPAILRSWFNRNHKNISKVLLKPPIRLLKSEKARRDARLLAKPKDIGLASLYEKGRRDTWDTLPNDFVPFTRMGPGFSKEIEYYRQMSTHVKSRGMPHYAKALDMDVSKFDEVLDGRYMGFIRMKMIDAAVIAAKTMGAKWESHRICIPASHFTRAFWSHDTKGKLKTDPMLSDVFDRHVTLDVNYRQPNGTELKLTFTPRVYPLDSFSVTRPPNIQRIIQSLESHPDANGHTLFDNYWVCVPSVTVNADPSNTWQFSDNDQVYKFLDYWQYATAVDRYLVQTGQIFPVILGENVSRKACYFISYYV